jgi:hypothetical protein
LYLKFSYIIFLEYRKKDIVFSRRKKKENLSKAELLLLSKFRRPHAIEDYSKSESWKYVLRREPERVIRDFYKNNLIEIAGLPDRVSFRYTVGDLKRILRKKGLPVSGKKFDLISRLIDIVPLEMDTATKNIEVFVCSEVGREISESFISEENNKREKAELLVVEALKNRAFETASKLVAEFEAQQIFPRGMGIDWEHYDAKRDIMILELIFSSYPKILKSVSKENIRVLQFFAAQMHLWGRNNVIKNQKAPKQIKSHLDINAASRMILFFALSKKNVLEYRKSGMKKVKVVSYVNDSHVCDYCQSMHNSYYDIDNFPEVPLENCVSDIGCRCIVEPVFS